MAATGVDHGEVLSNFVAITGADEAAALGLLEATGWRLEQAVALHFEAHEGGAGGGAGPSSSAGGGGLGAGGAGAGAGAALGARALAEEEAVRAPDAIKHERLYGEEYGGAGGGGGLPALGARSR